MVPKSKQKESGFKAVDLSIEIYNDILDLCLKMPNRYTYLILQPILQLAGEIMDNMVTANGIDYSKDDPRFLQSDVNQRHRYFMNAKGKMEALATRLNFFLINPKSLRHKVGGKEIGVTPPELDALSEKMDLELSLIDGVIQSDLGRLMN